MMLQDLSEDGSEDHYNDIYEECASLWRLENNTEDCNPSYEPSSANAKFGVPQADNVSSTPLEQSYHYNGEFKDKKY